MGLIKHIVEILVNTVMDKEVLARARRRKGAFTRNNGKLPYLTVIRLLLKNAKKSISSLLEGFFREVRIAAGLGIGETTTCTHQAYSKARAGIDHTIFKEAYTRILDMICCPGHNENMERIGGMWGIQPVAFDGSKIPLPNRKALRDKYGGLGQDRKSPTALMSVAYDYLSGLVLDTHFGPITEGEAKVAMRQIRELYDRRRVNFMYALFIFDRGYLSMEMLRKLLFDTPAGFLFRVRRGFDKDIDSLPEPQGDEIIDVVIRIKGELSLRVLRFRLESGETETLLTNKFSLDRMVFKDLYFMRWTVEGEYDIIKNKVGLTDFNGYAENSVLQEVWISVLLANIAAVLKKNADGLIKSSAKEGLKHRYQANMNELIGCVSSNIGDILDAEDDHELFEVLKYIVSRAASIKVVNKKGTGQSTPRKEPRKVKFHYNKKRTH